MWATKRTHWDLISENEFKQQQQQQQQQQKQQQHYNVRKRMSRTSKLYCNEYNYNVKTYDYNEIRQR